MRGIAEQYGHDFDSIMESVKEEVGSIDHQREIEEKGFDGWMSDRFGKKKMEVEIRMNCCGLPGCDVAVPLLEIAEAWDRETARVDEDEQA